MYSVDEHGKVYMEIIIHVQFGIIAFHIKYKRKEHSGNAYLAELDGKIK